MTSRDGLRAGPGRAGWAAAAAVLLWCGVTATSGTGDASAAAAGEVRAGAGREWFALPQRVPLAGYSKRRGRPSRGVHDAVGARALLIQDDETTVAFVSCDLLIIDERLFEAVRLRLIEAGLPERLVLVAAATHTHSGPGAYGSKFLEKISMGHFDAQVFEGLVRSMVKAVLLAREDVSTAQAVYATAMTEGLVQNRVDPSGPVDSELIIHALYRPAATVPFAVVVNFSSHPTTLGAWNVHVSADYPGVVAREVERRFPGAVCLFMAGSVGDQAPVKAGIGFERSEWIGRMLARDVGGALQAARPVSLKEVDGVQGRIPLGPAKLRLGARLSLPGWMSRWLVDDDALLSLVMLDKTAYVGVPCDLSAGLGLELKDAARSHGFDPVIVGFASDYIGYCLPPERYRAREYEALMAFNGPTTGPLLIGRVTGWLGWLAARDE